MVVVVVHLWQGLHIRHITQIQIQIQILVLAAAFSMRTITAVLAVVASVRLGLAGNRRRRRVPRRGRVERVAEAEVDGARAAVQGGVPER